MPSTFAPAAQLRWHCTSVLPAPPHACHDPHRRPPNAARPCFLRQCHNLRITLECQYTSGQERSSLARVGIATNRHIRWLRKHRKDRQGTILTAPAAKPHEALDVAPRGMYGVASVNSVRRRSPHTVHPATVACYGLRSRRSASRSPVPISNTRLS
ncbi:hypothetical protein M409DRAFT_54885 [Zasmidium cellare ATCC 36951]|uniref:Uncharacterized protein n=1 Tax=Zasmidium cellare ATCC 36951 TaxID=1080233 RepID=A0A6A6CK16_ZASCE|nr:uncharacterized protein M409DRAFT_54885 [Zasmidium cellare ATCC 36951]KAF2166548.1 hypothetical protein M409DRAFT_54885 [Zasmidium cellare ATCC 36951]